MKLITDIFLQDNAYTNQAFIRILDYMILILENNNCSNSK